jgi:hypothetical protein
MRTVSGSAVAHPSERATEVAHAWLREPLYRELVSESIRRREHVDALAAKIIIAAVILGLVDVLIDDAEKLLNG